MEKKFKIPDANLPLNPWMITLIILPIPLAFIVLVFLKLNEHRLRLSDVTQQFIQRQNTILAHDAMAVSDKVSLLLEKALTDAKTLSLIPPRLEDYQQFYRDHVGTKINSRTKISPLYNDILFFDPILDFIFRFKNGVFDKRVSRAAACLTKELCDRELLERSKTLKTGQFERGKLLRNYTPENLVHPSSSGSLRVSYRADRGIFIVGIDEKHLREILFTPTFPYHDKNELLSAYNEGNYLYIVDADTHIIAHPKPWHVLGLDQKTGEPVPPMQSDEDDGRKPIRIASYRGIRLKSYFNRLLEQSFQEKTIDIFKAPNLTGIIRVLSVVPIFVSGIETDKELFGYVISGCNVDFFEEPNKRLVPYY